MNCLFVSRRATTLDAMKIASAFATVLLLVTLANSQTSTADSAFKLALPGRLGQLQWRADGFTIIESSAKPNGAEIGLRGRNQSGRLTFLGFLFLVPEQAPMSAAKCRDGILDSEKKGSPSLKMISTSQLTRDGGVPVELVSYSAKKSDGKTGYVVRAFIATGESCGDLAFYSDVPITAADAELKPIFDSYRYDPKYATQFNDAFLYAQILYQHGAFQAAAPMFESALEQLSARDPNQQTMRRVTTDQAGMAYGISGNIKKARAIFEAAIKTEADYPLYYYNLACADAEENKLSDTRTHLEQAFARKKNMIAGETLPDHTKDDSFLPHQNDKQFWAFLQTLH